MCEGSERFWWKNVSQNINDEKAGSCWAVSVQCFCQHMLTAQNSNYLIAKNCRSVTTTEACTEACWFLTARGCQHKESLFHWLTRRVAFSDKECYFPQSGTDCAMWHNNALYVYYGTLWLTVSEYTYYVWMFTYASLHDLSCLYLVSQNIFFLMLSFAQIILL